MAYVALAALAAATVFVLGAITVAGMRGLGAWRSMRALAASLGTAAESLARRAEATSERVGELSERAERLSAALQRLQASRARLAILEAAAGDARAMLTAFRFVVPRK